MTLSDLTYGLGILVVVAPAVLLVVLGLTMLVRRPLSERATAVWTETAVFLGLTSSLLILVLMLVASALT